MFALYITHPQVQIDPARPVPDWGLSDVGIARARRAAAQPWARALRRIVSSAERKAIETADILAAAAGISVEIDAMTHENDRSSTGFLEPASFEAAADRFFAHPDVSDNGWERAADAQARIVGRVVATLCDHDPEMPIAFVGHGAVGTLLKSHLAGQPISRLGDQPAGGGNLYAFTLAERRLACDWTPFEVWQGV